MDGPRASGPRDGGDFRFAEDEAIDLSRYRAALRRGVWLIVLIVVPLTLMVLVLSLVLPKTYEAEATLVFEDQGTALAPADAQTSAQKLATIRQLLVSHDVLAEAAGKLDGETADTLHDKVDASVDGTTSLISIKAKDGDAKGAAAIANTVAATYVERRSAADRQRFAQARVDLEQALDRLRKTGGSQEEITAVRDRLSELSVSEVSGNDELQVAVAARPPERPESPRPLQNTVLALFAALFLAVLAAVGRDFMAPRVAGPRQFASLTGLAPLVVLPGTRRRRRSAEAEEAYQALAAAVRLELSESRRVVLVTGAQADSERAAVVAGLGRALTGSGAPTLLASADLRDAALHEELEVPRGPGVAEVLDRLESDPGESANALIASATRSHERPERGELRVLPSGDPSQHPAALLSGDALGTMFDELGRSEYRYVVVEGPPLLGPVDGQLVARWADAVIVVCRLDRLSPSHATELGDVVAGLDAPVLGAVLIGGGAVYYTLPSARSNGMLAHFPDGLSETARPSASPRPR
jgi:capsular polysaccharide biosynthesis protein/Mrp family chromosome partitioning ATPase